MRFSILFPRTNEQSSVVESFTMYNVVTVLSVPFEFYWLEGAIKIQFDHVTVMCFIIRKNTESLTVNRGALNQNVLAHGVGLDEFFHL